MRYLGWLLAGFGLFRLSRLFEGIGDSYPVAADGVSWDRLTWHGLALLVLLAALACFIRTGVLIWRLRGRGASTAGETARLTGPAGGPQAEPAFDPDAVIARYLAKKGGQPDSPAPRPPGGGFGRRGL